jgi:hypothetical protein
VYVAREGVTRVAIALSSVAVALGPAGIAVAVSSVVVRPLALVAWATPERARVIVIALPNLRSVMAQVVITIAVTRGATTSTVRRDGVPLVVT